MAVGKQPTVIDKITIAFAEIETYQPVSLCSIPIMSNALFSKLPTLFLRHTVRFLTPERHAKKNAITFIRPPHP